jgi:hypothetical protein
VNKQEVIYTLENGDDVSLTDYPGHSLVGAAWSSDGRYLAFFDRFLAGFPLKIYDFETQQQVDTSFVGADVDQAMGLHWSPDNRKVAVWARGRAAQESELEDNIQTLRHLVILISTRCVIRWRTDRMICG